MQVKNKFRKGEIVDMCKALQEWKKRDIQLGIEQGIEQFILDYLEEGFSKDRILSKLVKRFNLSDQQAADYFQKYTNEKP